MPIHDNSMENKNSDHFKVFNYLLSVHHCVPRLSCIRPRVGNIMDTLSYPLQKIDKLRTIEYSWTIYKTAPSSGNNIPNTPRPPFWDLFHFRCLHKLYFFEFLKNVAKLIRSSILQWESLQQWNSHRDWNFKLDII